MFTDKNYAILNSIVLFTHIMWFYVMGLTTPFQIRKNDYYSNQTKHFLLIR